MQTARSSNSREITGGITQWFYDFWSAAAGHIRGGYFPSSDTGDPGWNVIGYTAQLGNGLSATVSMETRRTTQLINAGNGGVAFANGNTQGTLNGAYSTTIASVSCQ